MNWALPQNISVRVALAAASALFNLFFSLLSYTAKRVKKLSLISSFAALELLILGKMCLVSVDLHLLDEFLLEVAQYQVFVGC